ncbi:MAG: D-lyxose/D-mannose family sugar isomerase [Eubacteriales bacterium]|nr:D-lyxose/D-mannose family sugar isomerase [Eubacteriales bacterium]
MRRSEVNRAIKDMEKKIEECCFKLPPFCSFTPEQWKNIGKEYKEVKDNMLGWDVTDFGSGDFKTTGFAALTLRNGNVKMPEKYTKTYAEKLLYMQPGQMLPMHFHWNKMEDIINRGGGNLIIRVYRATEEEELSKEDVVISCDGRTYTMPAGARVRLTPGESISLYPYTYHDFTVEEGTGDVLLGEVSMCNDDENDNRFLHANGRFSDIEEDEPPYRLLCNEYPE